MEQLNRNEKKNVRTTDLTFAIMITTDQLLERKNHFNLKVTDRIQENADRSKAAMENLHFLQRNHGRTVTVNLLTANANHGKTEIANLPMVNVNHGKIKIANRLTENVNRGKTKIVNQLTVSANHGKTAKVVVLHSMVQKNHGKTAIVNQNHGKTVPTAMAKRYMAEVLITQMTMSHVPVN